MWPGDQGGGEHFLQVARPLLITVITSLRPDLDRMAVSAATERIVLATEALDVSPTLWGEVAEALEELQSTMRFDVEGRDT